MALSLCLFDTVWVCITAVLFSMMEIETEGKNGWAKALPTTKNFIGKFTLYHVFMNLFVAFIFSGWFLGRFFTGCVSGKTCVLYFLFYMFLWFLLEDFLWFVFNPHYTLQKYCKDEIAWHTNWITKRIPAHNVICLLFLFVLALVDGTGFLFISLFLSAVFLAVCVYVANTYHQFYLRTHVKYL